jgi:hypothetical protein
MALSLQLAPPQPRRSLGGYTVGTIVGFQDLIMEALGPMIISPNPTAVPAVSYEYLF